MRVHIELKMLANHLRRGFLGLCLVMLLSGVLLAPGLPLLNVRAQTTFDCSTVTEIPQAECEALVALYESTGGPSWTDHTGWLESNTPCSWHGVYCGQGTVITLDFGPLCWGKGCEDLSMNLHGSIPPEIGNLPSLTILRLSYNFITSLPHEIGSLGNLSGLYLDRNLLSSLPPEIGSLGSLLGLDLDRNLLSSLPPEIGNLSLLTDLSLYENQLGSLPSEIGNLTNLKNLRLSYNQLASLPPEIGGLVNLEELYLSANRLADLPAEFGSLTNLFWLFLDFNQLTSLPPEIGNLSNLRYLYLYGNLLANLPPEIGNLSQLRTMVLSENQLSNLPPEIGNLSDLSWLGVENNQLYSLPSEIGNLTNLTDFYLSNNQLTSLPAEFRNLSNLVSLHLSYNRLIVNDPDLNDFISSRDLDWADTQTVPPSHLNLVGASPRSLEFAWKPIRYSSGGGGYELSIATHPLGPFSVYDTTLDKTSAHSLAENLRYSSAYYARLRTFSAAGGEQLQDLWSEYSPLMAILTAPVTQGTGASLEYPGEAGQVTRVDFPVGAVSEAGLLYFSSDPVLQLPFYLPLSGQAFSLGIYQDGAYYDDLPLLAPMTLTLEYLDGDYREADLRLVVWDAAAVKWVDAAQTCSPAGTIDHNLEENRLVVTACRLGTFALVEVWEVSHLPVMSREATIP